MSNPLVLAGLKGFAAGVAISLFVFVLIGRYDEERFERTAFILSIINAVSAIISLLLTILKGGQG